MAGERQLAGGREDAHAVGVGGGDGGKVVSLRFFAGELHERLGSVETTQRACGQGPSVKRDVR
jgi:hypothetical protein